MLVLVDIGVFMLVVICLTCLFASFHILSSWLLACYLVMVSLCGFTLVFTSLSIMVVYN
jgi:hypothetical protein